jgi:hypothetical protein
LVGATTSAISGGAAGTVAKLVLLLLL